MAGINDYSNTAGSNTTINGIDIAEGCSPAGINNAIRQLMADIADVDDGVVPLQTPDINGGTIDGAAISGSSTIDNSIIGGTTPAAGTFTTLTANTSITGTLNTAAQPNITSVGTLTGFTSTGIDDNATSTAITIGSDETVEMTSSQQDILNLTTSHASNCEIKLQGGYHPNLFSKIIESAGALIIDVDANNQETNSQLRVKVKGSEAMRIDSSGNVGIGTSSPDSLLHVYSSSPKIIIQDGGTHGTNSAPRLEFKDGSSIQGFVDFADDGTMRVNQLKAYPLTFRTNNVERMRITSSGDVGIGTSSPSTALEVNGTITAGSLISDAATALKVVSGGNSTTNGSNIIFYGGSHATEPNVLKFRYGTTETMRIDNQGSILVNNTSTPHSQNSVGAFKVYGVGAGAGVEGLVSIARYQGDPLLVNRVNNDGAVITIYGQGTPEGSINVSGATVTYNGFTGTHWSRLSDNSKPTILKGTILQSLDEMMDWYQVQFDITDDEGNTTTKKQSYALGDGESVGDVITYTYEGTDYQATIIQEGDVKHTKSKVSDTVDAKNVYGVFVDWDNDDDTVNDMYVAQTGTFVVRMNSSETVSKGDLIQSNGDGTGKVQADDIIRASTVAKILSTTKIETYDDGSYIVPCSLHC